jgi:hypothetical protein
MKAQTPKSLLLLICSSFLYNCSTINNYKYIVIPKQLTIPDYNNIHAPHIYQNDSYSCGTTSIAMAVSYYMNKSDVPLTKEEVWTISGLSIDRVHKYGNDMAGLLRISKYYGLKGEFHNGFTIEEIEYLLANNILVAINYRPNTKSQSTHMVLLTGYNRIKRFFVLQDPNNIWSTFDYMTYDDLLKRWTAFITNPNMNSFRSGFIIYPKDN